MSSLPGMHERAALHGHLREAGGLLGRADGTTQAGDGGGWGVNIAYNADCMEIMRQYPDKYFDLAVVDPFSVILLQEDT